MDGFDGVDGVDQVCRVAFDFGSPFFQNSGFASGSIPWTMPETMPVEYKIRTDRGQGANISPKSRSCA